MSNILASIVISGQYRENYGAHDWDGVGECPQYWKNKGSHEMIVVSNVPVHDWLEMMIEMDERKEAFDWNNTGSSCHFQEVVIVPNRLTSEEYVAWEYGNFEYIKSMSKEDIEKFLEAKKLFLAFEKAYYNHIEMESVQGSDYA